jgi:hypothetical protein
MLRGVTWFSGPPQTVVLTAVTAQGTGEIFKNITAGVDSIATAVAVVIGGLWAYFKFVRGRTFKPKLLIVMVGQWRDVPAVGNAFHVRVKVTNIGAAKAVLLHRGSGLVINFPAPDQSEYPGSIEWEPVPIEAEVDPEPRVFQLLLEHRWIEPGETVTDDLLLKLNSAPRIANLELWLGWKLPRTLWARKGVDVFARRIIPPDSRMIDTD